MREKYSTRSILITSSMQADTACQVIKNLPLDPVHPIEIVFREQVKSRSLDANALMWVGPLNDIAEQAWFGGKKFSAEIWHEYFKREYLPDQFIDGITKAGYKKWDYDPMGNRILVGSTTKLTRSGFSDYLEQVHSFGGQLGVLFSSNRTER